MRLGGIRTVLVPNSICQCANDTTQQIAGRSRLRPVLRQGAVEHDDFGGHLLNLTALSFVGAVCRGDQQSEHKSGNRPNQPRSQPHDIFCGSAQMMLWQRVAKKYARNCSAENACKDNRKHQQGTHTSFLQFCAIRRFF